VNRHAESLAARIEEGVAGLPVRRALLVVGGVLALGCGDPSAAPTAPTAPTARRIDVEDVS
jgi:hypothetical protein